MFQPAFSSPCNKKDCDRGDAQHCPGFGHKTFSLLVDFRGLKWTEDVVVKIEMYVFFKSCRALRIALVKFHFFPLVVPMQ